MSKDDDIREGFELLKQAMNKLSGGPVEFYLDQLIAARELIKNRFSPFKVGDRVTLTRPHPCEGNWHIYRTLLVPGNVAVVKRLDCDRDQRLFYYCEFEREFFINSKGEEQLSSRKGLFKLYEDQLEKVDSSLNAYEEETQLYRQGKLAGEPGYNQPTDKSDKYNLMAEKLLPCLLGCNPIRPMGNLHVAGCPHMYRRAVADKLREQHDEIVRQATNIAKHLATNHDFNDGGYEVGKKILDALWEL